eukprot:12304095-Alexandrium_andersonii.AAC.1
MDQQTIKTLRPSHNDTDEARTKAFLAMNNHLLTRAPRIYGRSKKALNCIKHPGVACSLSWQDPDGLHEEVRPLTMAIAGTPCRPWTRFAGKRSGHGSAHDDMEAWYLWLNDVRCQSYEDALIVA